MKFKLGTCIHHILSGLDSKWHTVTSEFINECIEILHYCTLCDNLYAVRNCSKSFTIEINNNGKTATTTNPINKYTKNVSNFISAFAFCIRHTVNVVSVIKYDTRARWFFEWFFRDLPIWLGIGFGFGCQMVAPRLRFSALARLCVHTVLNIFKQMNEIILC